MKPRSLLLTFGLSAALALGGLTGCSTGDRTAGRVLDDRLTTHRVKGALSDAPLYKFPNVQVQTFDGVVQLSGFVDVAEQRNRAGEIAANVQGVHRVVNSLVLKPEPAPANVTTSPTGYPSGRRFDATTQPPPSAEPPLNNNGTSSATGNAAPVQNYQGNNTPAINPPTQNYQQNGGTPPPNSNPNNP